MFSVGVSEARKADLLGLVCKGLAKEWEMKKMGIFEQSLSILTYVSLIMLYFIMT